MADEYKIPISFDLKTGDAASDGAKAGQQAAQGFQAAFKPKIDLGKSIDADALAKTIAASIQSAIKSLNIGDEIAKAFANIDLSKAGAGQTVGGGGSSRGGGAGGGTPPPKPSTPPPPSTPPQDFEAELNKRLKPVMSGLEAFGMLLRGASIGSALQTAVRDFNFAKATAATAASAAAAAGVGGGGGTGGSGPPRGPGGFLPPAIIPPGGGPTPPAGGGGFSLFGALGTAVKIGAAASFGGLAVGGIREISKAIADMGSEGAKADARVGTMAKTFNTSIPNIVRMQAEFKSAGVNMEDYHQSFLRMAVTARRQMPEIEDRFKRAGDTTEEFGIKAREADRNVAKSREDRVLATDKATEAEVELAKFEAIGASLREQQARSAALGVSGAQIGLRGAQIQQAAANVDLQMAGRDAALAEVQGPLTVAGAKLGVEGAELAESDAKARLRELRTGQKDDEFTIKQREIAKAKHAVDVAELNTKQAKARREQTENDEIRRQSMTAAGAGPVELAQQQAIQAAQAVEQARLGVDQAKTAQTGLAFTQKGNSLKAEGNQLQANVNNAQRNIGAAADAQQRAEAAARVAADDRDNKARYQDPRFIQQAIRDTIAGKQTEGFDLNTALGIAPDILEGAIFREGGYTGAGVTSTLKKFLQGQAAFGTPEADLLSTMQQVIPGRALMGEGGTKLLGGFLKGRLSPADEAAADEKAARIARDEPVAAAARAARIQYDKKQAEDVEKTNAMFTPFVPGAYKILGATDFEQTSKQWAARMLGAGSTAADAVEGFHDRYLLQSNPLSALTGRGSPFAPPMSLWDQYRPGQPIPGQPIPGQPPTRPDQASMWPPQPVPAQAAPTQVLPDIGAKIDEVGSAISGKTSTIPSAIDGVAAAISAKAGEIANINIPKGNVSGTASGGAEFVEQAAGGPIYGAGSETSDSIDARLSHGEYVVQAKAVKQVGVPFLNTLNAGKLQLAAGGLAEIDERKIRGLLGIGGGGKVLSQIDERNARGLLNIGGGGNLSEIDEREQSGTISLANGGEVDAAVVKALIEAGIDPKSAFDNKGNLRPEAVQQLAMAKAIANMKGLSPAAKAALMAANRGFTPGYNPKGSGITDAVRFAPGFGPPKTPDGVPPGSEISPGGGFYRDPREGIKIWRTVPGAAQAQPSGGRDLAKRVPLSDRDLSTPIRFGGKQQPAQAAPSTTSKTITAPPSAEPPREPPPPTKEQMPLDITLPSDYVPKQRYEELLERGPDIKVPAGTGDKPGTGQGDQKEGKPAGGAADTATGEKVSQQGRPGPAPTNDGNKYVTINRNGKLTHYLVGKDANATGSGKDGTATGTGTTDFKQTLSIPGQEVKGFDPNQPFKEGIPPLPYRDIYEQLVPKGTTATVVPKEGPPSAAQSPGERTNIPVDLITAEEYEAIKSRATAKEATGNFKPQGGQLGTIIGPARAGNEPINVPPPPLGGGEKKDEKTGDGGFPSDRFQPFVKPGRGGVGPQSTLMPSELNFRGAHVQANPAVLGAVSALGHIAAGALFGYGPSIYEKYKEGQAAKERASNYEAGVGQLKDEFRKNELFKDDPTTNDALDPKYQPVPSDTGQQFADYIPPPPPPPPPEPPPEEEKDKVYARTGGYVRDLMRGFAGGGFVDSVGSVRGYADGGSVIQQSGLPGPNLSAHQLDLRTDSGTFSSKVDDDTFRGISNSALARKLVEISKPATWHS